MLYGFVMDREKRSAQKLGPQADMARTATEGFADAPETGHWLGKVADMRNWYTQKIVAVLYDRKGISAMEYAILGAAVLGAVGTAVTTLGGDITKLFDKMNTIVKTIVG